MKFGFGTKPSDPIHNYVAMVQNAEAMGFDYAWVPDQTFYRDPFMVLGALAQSTQDIQLGVGVTNPYTRHPAMIARCMGTLNEMAPGRANLGIGAGNRKELLNPLGYEGLHAGRMCLEMVQVINAFLSPDQANFKGQHFQVEDVALEFNVPEKVPCFIAGRGPLVLEAAGEVADGAIIGGLCTPPGIQYALKQIKTGLDKSNRSLDEIEIVAWVTCRVTDDLYGTVDELRPVIAHLIGGAPYSVLEALALDMDVVNKIKSIYKQEGIPQAAKYVTFECVEAFTLVGNGKELTKRISDLEQAGVTQVSILMPPGNTEQHTRNLQNFVETVFPAFH